MSRYPGTLNFAANFEPKIQAPLDARQKVSVFTDLVDPATWQDPSGNSWIFKGALVVVSDDPSSGLYLLKDADFTNYSNWSQLGSISSDIYSYIDGSLAARDSSISDLYSRINFIDSSISYLINWNISQDASIIDLQNIILSIDASIQRIDSSINDLYSREVSINVVNVGDGSVNIFAGFDSSGAIQIKSISGSGAAVVSEVANNIIISLDASFSGEVNTGANVGDGDASIFYRKNAQTLEFREIKGAGAIHVSVSDNIIVLDASISTPAPSGAGIDGGVWITNIVANGAGNVGAKVYSSDGAVLDYCLTDTSSLTVSVLALPGHTNYKPVVTINSNPVTLVASADKPLFTGTYNMLYNFADASITVLHEDGANWSTIVDADIPPVILNAHFTGGYPGVQTELKENDTYQIQVDTDVPVTEITIDNYGAFKSLTTAVSGTNFTVTGTIANRGNTTQALGFSIRVKKSTGSTSTTYLSASYGSTNGYHVVNLNNTYPTITFTNVLYPTGQGAIKTGETATVNHTVTNFDTISYSSPTGELTIANPSTYTASKSTTYLSGGYNITTNNFAITANRAANNANSSGSYIVWIANTPATLSVGGYSSRLRSGGNDGTSAQSHTITITSSQRLLNAPSLVKDTGGTWLGTGFSWSAAATSFTRSLQVHDNDIKGTYSWGAISGTNLAGIVTSTNSGSTQYILGGFVLRTISVAAFGWQSNINVAVSDYSKLSSSGTGQVLAWSVSNMNTRSTLGDVTRPQASVWSASATGTNPTTINILDKSATDSASQASSFTIQEAI